MPQASSVKSTTTGRQPPRMSCGAVRPKFLTFSVPHVALFEQFETGTLLLLIPRFGVDEASN
jgi:hypothetical protein